MGRGDILARTRRKPKEGKTGKNTIFIWLLVLLFFFLCGSFVFLRSPFFHVKRFEIQGIKRVSREEIEVRAGQKGINIFAFDLDKARKRIEASPFIEKAICTRKLPDTIFVTVKERVPLAFVPFQDKIFLIDKEGRVLGEDDGTSPSLKGLTGVTEVLHPGQFLDRAKYSWGLDILSYLSSCDVKATEINVQDGDCTLILEDGCKVFFGREKRDLGRLFALLTSILSDLAKDGRSAEYIDLRFEKPSLKLRSFDGR